jgi:hypothetical protein
MCAIKPVHHIRVTFDVYTSDTRTPHHKFHDDVLTRALQTEIMLNSVGPHRWHVSYDDHTPIPKKKYVRRRASPQKKSSSSKGKKVEKTI